MSTALVAAILAVGPGAVDASEVPAERFEAPVPKGDQKMGEDMDASGDTWVVGAPGSFGADGEVHIYTNPDAEVGVWSLVQSLTGSTVTAGFGRSVAVDQNTLAVGSDDSISIYGRTGPVATPWVLVTEITGTGQATAMDLADDSLIVAYGLANLVEIRDNSNAYTAAIATLSTTTALGSDLDVAISPAFGAGSAFAAVGLPRDPAGGSGELGIVYTYKKSSGTWNTAPDETLTNPDADITNDGWFGSSLAADVDKLIVGHALEDEGAADSGAVWVIDGAPGSFGAPEKLKASDVGLGDAFGLDVGYDTAADLLIVGSPADNNPGIGRTGSAYVFEEIGGAWTEVETLSAYDAASNDQFGHSVAITSLVINGNETAFHAFAGAIGADTALSTTPANGGAAYSFTVREPEAPTNKIISPDGPLDRNFGQSVANVGDTLIIGHPGETGADGFVRVYVDSGAAYVGNQTQTPLVTAAGFGEHVAASGNTVAVAYRDVGRVDIYERPDGSSPYVFVTNFSVTGTITSIDLGPRGLIVGQSGPVAVDVFVAVSPGNWSGTINTQSLTPPGAGAIGDVAITNNLAAVTTPDNAGFGQVGVYTAPIGTSFATTPNLTLTNPDADTTNDVFFGQSVDIGDELSGWTLVVGNNDSDSASFSGSAWFYDLGERINPTDPLVSVNGQQKVKSSDIGTSDGFGSSVDLDTDIAIVGSRGAGNGPGLNGRTGSAFIVKRNVDTGVWSVDSEIQHPDRTLFDRFYGQSVTVSGGRIAVGAPWDHNENGERAGAVYTWSTSIPVSTVDNPTLTISVAPGSPSAPAGATGISVVDLPPTAIEGYGGDSANNIAGTSLNTVDGAATATDPSELLDGTTIGDLGLTGSLLSSILLSDIIIEGGWDVVLAGTALAGLPLQNVTLAEALATGNLNGATLSTLDLSATPVGSIPVGSIALAATPVGSIPLEGGQDWCDVLLGISPAYNCTTAPAADPATDSLIDLAIQGAPVGSIPVGSIPVGSIPIGSIPVGSIPVGSIDIAGTPVGSIPVGSIPVGSIPVGSIPVGSIPVGSIPVGSIPVGSIPVGSIPVGSITIGGIQLGDLTANGGIAASPVGSIPVGSIPVGSIPVGSIPVGSIPVGSIPVGSIPVGSITIAGTPVGSIPVGSIDIAGTPVGSIPVGSIPVGSIPVGSIPVGSIPVGSIPVGSIPVGSIPVGSIPVGSIDLAASPVGSIPVGSIPVGSIGSIVDCDLIDCDPAAGFTLGDAQDAGALTPGVTLAAFEGLNTGVTMADLIGLGGFDETAIRAQIDGQTTVSTLEEFLTFDNMTLVDLPRGPELGTTVLADLGTALSLINLADLLAATGGDESALRAQFPGVLDTLTDFLSFEGMVLSDLPTGDINFQNQTINDLLPAFQNIRLGDILDFHPTLDGSDVNWTTLTLADIGDWQDVTLGELAGYNGTTLAELILALPPAIQDELTFGDLLLAIVGTEAHDWSDIELGALELDAASSPVTFNSVFEVTGGLGIDRTVTLRTTIPLDGVYVPGSTVFTNLSSGPLPGGTGEPVIDGNQLSWTLTGVVTGDQYEVAVDIAPSLSLGTSTVSTDGTIAGVGVQSSGLGTVGISQAFEPNDMPGDSGILSAVTDTIYASHIGDADDVDLFRIDLAAGSRLAVSLSDLPADFDLVLYGPPAVPVSDQPALRELNPTDIPEVTLDSAANDSGGAVLQDVPLQDIPVIDISNNRDTENETIDIASVRTTGTYYIQVSGYSGATSVQPYALYVKAIDPPAPLVCAAQNYQSGAIPGALPSAAALAGVNTLILVNEERLVGKYGTTDAAVALDAIDDLVQYTNTTNTGLGINAVVVPVDRDGNVRSAYNDLDGAACEPDRSNAVVREINRVIDDMRAGDPATEIEHIMIVGDDDIIPMARLADDTTIANESGYAQTFIGANASSLFGALINSNFLSDEPYGDIDPIQSGDRVLYVTDVALGRMVEQPAEIAGQVLAFIGFDGLLDTSTAVVTGYDFLDDGAQAVSDALAGLPDTTSVDDLLINETWTANDVDAKLFPAAGASPQVASVNAHYDHYRALPADQNAAGIEDDLYTTADVDLPSRVGALTGRTLFSMGCHSGLSVPDELFPGGSDPRALDWAQVYARQGATWVGNTGYGYGETEGIELSERLMALYAERLDGSVSAGEALFYAKQTYLGTQQAEYGAFDEKVLQQATFYGIPFYQLDVAVAPPPAPLPPQPTVAPVAGSSLNVAVVAADPAFSENAVAGQGSSYDASIPAGDPGLTDRQATPYAPIQPTASFDVSYVDAAGEPVEVAQGALITSLTTSDVGNVDPDLALPIVDDSAVEVEPQVGDVNTDPAVFVSTYETPEGPRQALTSLLGTFTSDQPDGTGTQRLFEELTLDVYYRSPASDADQSRPTFTAVDSTISSGVLTISATVDDTAAGGPVTDNIVRVLALVVEDAGTNTAWSAVELVSTGGRTWGGSVAVTGSEIEYLLQAVDGAGNTAITTNKSRLFAEDPTPPPPDPTISVSFSSPAANDPYYNATVIVTGTADGEAVDYQIDGGEIITAGVSAAVLLDPAVIGDGLHTVTFTAGNAVRTESVLFDTTDPVVLITSPADGVTYPSGTPIAAVFSCADSASGTATCDATLDGAPIAAGTDLTPGVGGHTLALTGTDSVGNSASTSVTFDVEAVVGGSLTIDQFDLDGIASPGENVDLAIEFQSDGTAHSVTIDWGDATSCTEVDSDCSLTEPANGAPGQVLGSHVYASGGAYTVTVTVTSDQGAVEVVSMPLATCTIIGTSGNDVLVGTNGSDVICGLGGRDTIRGRGGNDILIGGSGRDFIIGGNGNDLIIGLSGNDDLFGGRGDDELRGGQGNDFMHGFNGLDTMVGGLGNDRMFGGAGNDVMSGGDGNDRLVGEQADDIMLGGAGRDLMWGNDGNDEMIGGDGRDSLNGGSGNDKLQGNGDRDVLNGLGGDDELEGGPGRDLLRGGSGDDDMDGGDDRDRCIGGSGTDTRQACEL